MRYSFTFEQDTTYPTEAGGVVPHDAQSILTNRYGDCKDHVVLLEALLRAVGIESSPALINAQRTYILPKLATTGVFDDLAC